MSKAFQLTLSCSIALLMCYLRCKVHARTPSVLGTALRYGGATVPLQSMERLLQESLMELGLLSLKRRRVQEDLKGPYKKTGEGLSRMSSRGRTGGQWIKIGSE